MPTRSPTGATTYSSAVETSADRFLPVMPVCSVTIRSCSSASSAVSAPLKTPPFIAPASRMRRVRALVSIPEMPTMPSRTRCSSSEALARWFDTTRLGSRTTYPATQMRRDSGSSSFTPVLPMCGAVCTTIWPAYDGSVSVSW